MVTNMKTNLKALTVEEISKFVENHEQSPYRTKQLINWIYKKLATSLDEMTDLPMSFREVLKKVVYISNLILLKRQLSKDGTQKFLFELEDGKTVESVLIYDEKRLTLCISSQVGCAMRCKFCMTGKFGLERNLKAYEIVDQVIAVSRVIKKEFQRDFGRGTSSPFRITNIVFMGMGEPLDNFDEVIDALWRLTGLMGFSRKKITVSTAGIVPQILELSKKGPGVNLAISLNATTDEVRNKIMPINKKYPLKELLNVCKRFPLSLNRKITFEYVLLEGINDSQEDALRLIKLLRGIRSKVNLIPYNPITAEVDFKKPEDVKVLAFQKILVGRGIRAIIRKSKGEDIMAACGQLTADYSSKNTIL